MYKLAAVQKKEGKNEKQKERPLKFFFFVNDSEAMSSTKLGSIKACSALLLWIDKAGGAFIALFFF